MVLACRRTMVKTALVTTTDYLQGKDMSEDLRPDDF